MRQSSQPRLDLQAIGYTTMMKAETMRPYVYIFDLVDKVMATIEQRLIQYQDHMAKHHNSWVRHRDFKIGDLVLRKVMGAARDPTQGKLGPN